MALKSSEVRVAGTGELFLAPVGTALPTAASTALPAIWVGYGYTTDDGVTIARSVDTEDVNAWQSSTPVRTIITGQSLTVDCTFLQTNELVTQLWLGSGNFATDAGTPAGYRADVPVDAAMSNFAMVLEWKDGTITSRLAIPKVTVSETGDLTIARAASTFPVTFSALAPDTGTVLATWLTTDAAFAVGA